MTVLFGFVILERVLKLSTKLPSRTNILYRIIVLHPTRLLHRVTITPDKVEVRLQVGSKLTGASSEEISSNRDCIPSTMSSFVDWTKKSSKLKL